MRLSAWQPLLLPTPSSAPPVARSDSGRARRAGRPQLARHQWPRARAKASPALEHRSAAGARLRSPGRV